MAAAEDALARQKFVTPIDVCLGVRWLHPSHVDSWRHGRVRLRIRPALDRVLAAWS